MQLFSLFIHGKHPLAREFFNFSPMNKAVRSSNNKFRMLIIPVVSCIFLFSLIIINPLSEWQKAFNDADVITLVIDVFIYLVFGWIITECSLLVSHWLDKKLPWQDSPKRRFAIQLVLQSIAVILVFMLVMFLLELTTPESERDDDFDWVDLRQFFFMGILLSFIITAIYTGDYLIRKWRDSVMEAAAFKQVALQAELQSLKAQLDPHFMFNNFSTLANLIVEGPDDALAFLHRLSQVYRYMINNLEKDVISLKEELDFIEAYIYLIRIRFGDNLHISMAIPDVYKTWGIAPASLQLLVENAVKHNIAAKTQPLYITIGITDHFMLEVKNNLQRITAPTPSTKMGLQNIRQRYRLLTGKEPVITETADTFSVQVPLIEL